MKNIYCYVAQDGYAARVKDTKSYESVRYPVSYVLELAVTYNYAVARTSWHVGHFHLSQMIIIPAVTSMNIYAATNIWQRMET